jgi:protein NUD1
MNPATLGWYLPILVRDIPGALQPSETLLVVPLIPTSGDREAPNHSAVRFHPFSAPRDVRDNRASVGRHAKDATWENLDAKFRRDLPDSSYLGRLAYRGMVMRACPNVRVIDGVTVADGEREKAEKLLTSLLLARKTDGRNIENPI